MASALPSCEANGQRLGAATRQSSTPVEAAEVLLLRGRNVVGMATTGGGEFTHAKGRQMFLTIVLEPEWRQCGVGRGRSSVLAGLGTRQELS